MDGETTAEELARVDSAVPEGTRHIRIIYLRVEVAGHGAAGQAALERRTLQEGRSRVGGNAEVAASLANALDEFEPL
ncbi:MAG TPA: hypothetical protein VN688_00130, partial [Gemmataceae bacterium]|nr:hypothetical protein [Gemmataceae bacterium]